MPVALTIAPDPPAPLIPPRKRWTRAECAVLESSGIWEQQKLELIDGELISKMGKGRPHVVALTRILYWLMDVFGWDRVNPAAPIDVAPEDNPTNEPEPDAIVFKLPGSGLQTVQPQPGELALVLEVADTTLRFDLTVKAGLYARAGIVEYWVVDVNGRRLIVHREPCARRLPLRGRL
jgi:Uma2 family endonuclease